MKKNLISVTLALTVIILLFCLLDCRKSSPPVDCFAAIPDTVFVGQPVNFLSCTKGAVTTLWNFGDGMSSSADSAAHTYTTAGVYHGSLTTSNGHSSTQSFTVVVINNAAGYFTFDSMSYFPAVCDSSEPNVVRAYLFADSLYGANIAFGFTSIPTTSGYYNVSGSAYVNGVLPGQIIIAFLPHGANAVPVYHSSSSNSNKQVYVTVMANRLLNFAGTNIEMINLYAPYDSFPATFNITMTQ